nr:LysR substrate-binding domain-containing protein [Holdemania sp. 1001095H_141210_F2]
MVIIAEESPGSSRWTINNACPGWECSSLEALLEAARQNLGVTLLSQPLAHQKIETRRFTPVIVSDFRLENSLSQLCHKQKYKTPAMLKRIRLAETTAQD